MANTAVVGINWGDEGKGRVIDFIAHDYDVCVRAQGGSNAGHTVVNDYGHFVLNNLPAGVFTRGCVCVIGSGSAVNVKELSNEIASIRRTTGIPLTHDTLLISERATLVLPIHSDQERWEEERLGDRSLDSMLRGIGPAYADRHLQKSLVMGDLKDPALLRKRLNDLIGYKNSVFCKGYGTHRVDPDDVYEWLVKWSSELLPFITDTDRYLGDCLISGRRILFEGQNGALRDPVYGIYPYANASSTLASSIPYDAGCPALRLDSVLGVTKAYSTCIGRGPFVGELSDPAAETIREAGSEYGAATGRPRRVGWFDAVAARRGAALQGAGSLALTKLDVLDSFDEIPVITAYRYKGEVLHEFPDCSVLAECEPVCRVLPGWKSDISTVRDYARLPENARRYVEFIEREVRVPVSMISVGAQREDVIVISR